jgi:hypothetical protein
VIIAVEEELIAMSESIEDLLKLAITSMDEVV